MNKRMNRSGSLSLPDRCEKNNNLRSTSKQKPTSRLKPNQKKNNHSRVILEKKKKERRSRHLSVKPLAISLHHAFLIRLFRPFSNCPSAHFLLYRIEGLWRNSLVTQQQRNQRKKKKKKKEKRKHSFRGCAIVERKKTNTHTRTQRKQK